MKDRICLLVSSLALVFVIKKFMMGEDAKFAMMVMLPMLGAGALAFALFKSGKEHQPTPYEEQPVQKS